MRAMELNKQNFKKFGNIIAVDEKLCIAKLENFKYYLIDSMKSDSEITIGLLEVIKKINGTGPFERHHLTEEVILPLKGDALLHLAESEKSSLTSNDIATFRINPGVGVKLYKDVWHAIPVIESSKSFLCLILKNKTEEEDLYFAECK
jgi:ureidoglycolate hydrolase